MADLKTVVEQKSLCGLSALVTIVAFFKAAK